MKNKFIWTTVFLVAMKLYSTDMLEKLLGDDCATPLGMSAVLNLQRECIKTLLDKEVAVDLAVPKRLTDWGSGGLGGSPWQFATAACNDIFVELMRNIASTIESITLSPHDLFHGHVMSYGEEGSKEIAVVLHAKEYPADLEKIKNRYQVEEDSFSSDDMSFSQRNFLFLSRVSDHEDAVTNEVFLINNSGECSQYFSANGINTLSEELVADGLDHGKAVGDVNVFMPNNISRIEYMFYPGLVDGSNELILDYEAVESGKSVYERILENALLEHFVSSMAMQPIVYFLTGRSFVEDESTL